VSETTQKFLAKPSSSYKILLWTTLALSILGAIMVFSASSIYSLENKGNSFLKSLLFSLAMLVFLSSCEQKSIDTAVSLTRKPLGANK
jgi:cell division protein FtsW